MTGHDWHDDHTHHGMQYSRHSPTLPMPPGYAIRPPRRSGQAEDSACNLDPLYQFSSADELEDSSPEMEQKRLFGQQISNDWVSQCRSHMHEAEVLTCKVIYQRTLELPCSHQSFTRITRDDLNRLMAHIASWQVAMVKMSPSQSRNKTQWRCPSKQRSCLSAKRL